MLFRDGKRSYQAFAQEASYLFEDRPLEEEWFNGSNRTLECTKVMMAMKWYLVLALHGPGFFADYVDGMLALASRFADRIASSPDFELGVRPDCNIVCFRHVRDRLRVHASTSCKTSCERPSFAKAPSTS